MILKDDAETIQASLQSVRPWIQSYVLIEAASTDETLDLALQELKGIKGKVYQSPWATSQPTTQELLSLAKNQGDYLLWISPDEKLVVKEKDGFGALKKDRYDAVCRADGVDWRRPFLLRSGLDWRGGDLFPQDLFSPRAKTSQLLSGCVLSKMGKNPLKEKRKLKEALQRDPANGKILLHLARAVESFGESEEALRLYEKRSAMGGEPQEVFYSLYRIAALQEKRGDCLEKVIESYLKAYHCFPNRAEPLFDLAERMIQDENYVLGYVLSEFALTIPRPADLFLQKSWIYEHGLLYQFAVCALKIQRIKEANRAIEALPEEIRKLLKKEN